MQRSPHQRVRRDAPRVPVELLFSSLLHHGPPLLGGPRVSVGREAVPAIVAAPIFQDYAILAAGGRCLKLCWPLLPRCACPHPIALRTLVRLCQQGGNSQGLGSGSGSLCQAMRHLVHDWSGNRGNRAAISASACGSGMTRQFPCRVSKNSAALNVRSLSNVSREPSTIGCSGSVTSETKVSRR